MATNLAGVWRGMKVAVPQMLKRGGGAVVNMSSVQSLDGFKGWAAYAAAKGGINALTQQTAIDLAPFRHPGQRGGARHDHDAAQPADFRDRRRIRRR